MAAFSLVMRGREPAIDDFSDGIPGDDSETRSRSGLVARIAACAVIAAACVVGLTYALGLRLHQHWELAHSGPARWESTGIELRTWGAMAGGAPERLNCGKEFGAWLVPCCNLEIKAKRIDRWPRDSVRIESEWNGAWSSGTISIGFDHGTGTAMAEAIPGYSDSIWWEEGIELSG